MSTLADEGSTRIDFILASVIIVDRGLTPVVPDSRQSLAHESSHDCFAELPVMSHHHQASVARVCHDLGRDETPAL